MKLLGICPIEQGPPLRSPQDSAQRWFRKMCVCVTYTQGFHGPDGDSDRKCLSDRQAWSLPVTPWESSPHYRVATQNGQPWPWDFQLSNKVKLVREMKLLSAGEWHKDPACSPTYSAVLHPVCALRYHHAESVWKKSSNSFILVTSNHDLTGRICVMILKLVLSRKFRMKHLSSGTNRWNGSASQGEKERKNMYLFACYFSKKGCRTRPFLVECWSHKFKWLPQVSLPSGLCLVPPSGVHPSHANTCVVAYVLIK